VAPLRDLGAGQLMLVSVVSIGWLAVVIGPLIARVDIDTHVRIGVMGAMTLVLGAVFGVRYIGGSGKEGE
jgi:hypothetical protein